MKKDVLLELSCAFLPPSKNGYGSARTTGNERVVQYAAGFESFFRFFNPVDNVHVYVTDNTLMNFDQVDDRIRTNIQEDTEIIFNQKNSFGRLNNGAGNIEVWLYDLKEKRHNYEWLVHHEPRQTLLNFDFINSFLEYPRALFTMNNNPAALPHFNTGLFAMKLDDLWDYCNSIDLNQMVANCVSIEYSLYHYVLSNKIDHELMEEMGVMYYPEGSPPEAW